MRAALAAVVQGGGLAAALLLPLWFNPYARVPFEPAKIALFWVVTATMALAWLGQQVMGLAGRRSVAAGDAWQIWRRVPLLVCAAVAYAGVVLLATAISVDSRLSLWGTPDKPAGAVTLLAGVLFFLLLASVLRGSAQINRLVHVLILASVPVVVYGFAQALGLDPLPWITDSVSPVHATLGRSNFLGAYLAMVAPWTLALAVLGSRHGEDGARYVTDGFHDATDGSSTSGFAAGPAHFWIILILQVVCLALTLARGAWMGLTVGCVSLLVLLAIRWHQRRLWLAAGLALAVGAAGLAALTFVRLPAGTQQAAAAGMSYPELRVESAWRRSIIWQHALALVPQRWLLGYGPATFQPVFSSRYPPGTLYQGGDAVVDDPHNLLLERLLATGVLGLAAYGSVVIAFYRVGLALWRRPSDRWRDALAAAALASVAAYLTQALFNPDVMVLNMLFWLALAVLTAVTRSRMAGADQPTTAEVSA